MKRFSSFFLAILLACTAWIWHGCEADVDVNNIDTTVGVDATVALPIGSVSATIGDFVGNGTWGIFVDSLQNRGVLTFRDTFSISRKFHTLDLSQYLSKASMKMNVYESLDKNHMLIDGKIAGIPVDLRWNDDTKVIIGWSAVSELSEEEALASDKAMRNRGYMRGPGSIILNAEETYGSMRDSEQAVRKIIGTYRLDKRDYWLRFKDVSENSTGKMKQFDQDYLELVPTTVLADPTKPEDIY